MVLRSSLFESFKATKMIIQQSITRQMISFLFKYVIRVQQQARLFAEAQYWVTVSEFCEPISSGNRATYLPVDASIRWR